MKNEWMTTLSAMDYQSFSTHLKQLADQKQLSKVEQIALIRFRAEYDFEFFILLFFGHYCQFALSAMHKDLCQAEQDPYKRGRREVIAAPRGHAKTTFIALFKVLHAIVYGYDPYILIISFSAQEAGQKVLDILNELTNNELLKVVYGDLAPKQGEYKGKARWGTKRFVTRNGIKVEAKSRGKQVRGMKEGANRPSLIICDDVESSEGVLNSEQRQKTADWFKKDILKLGQSDNTTNILFVGTCLHPDSLLSELLRTPGWMHRFYQAVQHFAENQTLWNQYKALYTDLSNPTRVETAHTFYLENKADMLQGVQVLWPECDPYEKLIRMQIDEGMASFQSEKQNTPYDPERQIFNMSQAKYFKFVYQNGNRIGVQWTDGSERTVLFRDMHRIVAFHDPSIAESKKSDYAAIVVAAKDADGYIYCMDVFLEKVPITRQLEQVFYLYKAWGFTHFYVETVSFQKLLKMNYRDMQAQHPDCQFEIIGVDQHHNKEKRISTLEPLITNGYLLFSDSLPSLFIDQLTQFPTTYDDGPDALQGAVAQLKKTYEPGLLGMPIQVGHGPNLHRRF